ncbi:C45 family autoproteolytic acyltransferase/hydolase [Bosea sp. (in: a-proteobacteria)]|uniref:C45 family autoproteolytic acyltransferase/hydolase n=1 Tax=Bosea sp. (in: a-proteobacteria) TaxID=1871050 RepID=UPI003B3AD25D
MPLKAAFQQSLAINHTHPAEPAMTIAPFPLISVSGKPRERGRAYGEAAAERVLGSIALYGGQLSDLGYSEERKAELIAGFVREIDAFDPSYPEEMAGIAEGAGVAFEDVVMINARTEVMAKARRESNRPVDASIEPDDGCTGAVILPERSASGRLIHGQNWDWRSECAETSVVLCVRRDDGPDFLTFVEAGGLARSGLNQAGLSITANYLDSERDYKTPGVPLVFIRRKVLEQAHFAMAVKAVAATPKVCSNNMMIATAEGFAIDFECAPDEAFPLYPSAGLIVHANHWVSAVALAKLKDTGIASVPDSVYRDWRVSKLLREAGEKLTPDDLKHAFFDEFAKPYSVCRPPRPGLRDNNLSATVAMVVMDPGQGVMEVAPLPALNRSFTRYSLD